MPVKEIQRDLRPNGESFASLAASCIVGDGKVMVAFTPFSSQWGLATPI
jgi:hypothetical protein